MRPAPRCSKHIILGDLHRWIWMWNFNNPRLRATCKSVQVTLREVMGRFSVWRFSLILLRRATAPPPIWYGSGFPVAGRSALPGRWALAGRSLGALGALLGAPGRSWALLGAPGRSGSLRLALARFWALRLAPTRLAAARFWGAHGFSIDLISISH